MFPKIKKRKVCGWREQNCLSCEFKVEFYCLRFPPSQNAHKHAAQYPVVDGQVVSSACSEYKENGLRAGPKNFGIKKGSFNLKEKMLL